MESELLKLAATQGIWAALSIVLIFYILKDQKTGDLKQEEREKNYQEIIAKLSNKMDLLDDIEMDIKVIKEFIR